MAQINACVLIEDISSKKSIIQFSRVIGQAKKRKKYLSLVFFLRSICKIFLLITVTTKCYIVSCSVDGDFTDWSPWTSCSRSCGDGRRKRTRTCTDPPPDMGKNCTGAYDEVEVCDSGTCPGTTIKLHFSVNSGIFSWNVICTLLG